MAYRVWFIDITSLFKLVTFSAPCRRHMLNMICMCIRAWKPDPTPTGHDSVPYPTSLVGLGQIFRNDARVRVGLVHISAIRHWSWRCFFVYVRVGLAQEVEQLSCKRKVGSLIVDVSLSKTLNPNCSWRACCRLARFTLPSVCQCVYKPMQVALDKCPNCNVNFTLLGTLLLIRISWLPVLQNLGTSCVIYFIVIVAFFVGLCEFKLVMILRNKLALTAPLMLSSSVDIYNCLAVV